jgi:predicted Ser/Thr protein kinase
MTERQIGNYRILKQIGAGGMAKVYLAVHKDVPNLKVVLKILSGPQHAARFMQEADKLALLERNPNICHIRHFFNHEDELVIAMEYIDGKSLEEMIAEQGKFSVEETVKITAVLLTALAFAHEKEIYHRDIKPGNIMFDRDGQLKIIDFGIAKGKTDPQMTIVGTSTGTPEYMAPEQFAGGEHLDYAKCDIYAVGTMMYTMLTGRPPFKGENEFVLRDAKLFEDPVPPSRLAKEISGELDKVILRAINKDPAKRFASVVEMKSELLKLAGKPGRPAKEPSADTAPASAAGQAAEHVSTSARATSSTPSSRRKVSRKGGKGEKIAGAVIGLVVVATAAIFGIKMMSGEDGGKVTMPAKDSVVARRPSLADTQKIVESAPPGTGGALEPGENGSDAGTVPDKAAEKEKPVAATGTGTAAGTKPERSAPPAPGFLKILSRPRNAAIYINGELQYEKTPFTFDRPPGQYTVRMVLIVGGKELEYSKKVELESGETEIVSHNFEE